MPHRKTHTVPVVFDGGPQRAPGGGCSGKQMAPSTPVCISSFPTSACSPSQGENLQAKVLLLAPRLASTVMDLIALLRGSPWCLPVRQDMLSQAQGQISLPNSGKYRLHVWPLDGSQPGILERSSSIPLCRQPKPRLQGAYASRWERFSR